MDNSLVKIPNNLWLIAAVTGAGAFMAMLDSTVVNLALATLMTEFNVPIEKVQWVVTTYLIALAVSLPMTGWFGRRYGLGRMWAISVIGFSMTSLLCACSGSLNELIFARTAQGFAAGVMVPAGQAILASNADKRQLGRLMGVVGFAVALGPAVGPGFGGILIEHISWRWLFGINVVVGLISLILAKISVPAGNPIRNSKIDKRGLLLAVPGIPLLLFGVSELATVSNHYAFEITLLGGILMILFVWHAFYAPAPLIRVRLFLNPRFTAGAITAGFTGAAMYGGLLALPLLFQAELSISISNTGILLLIMGLGSAFALPIAGTLTDRFGAGLISMAGCILLIVGTAPFLMSSSLLSRSLLVVLLFVRGVGLALAQMPAMTAVYGAVKNDDTGDAAVLVNITQRLGGALGAIIIVIALNQSGRYYPGDEFTIAFVLLTVLAVGALCSATRMLRCKP